MTEPFGAKQFYEDRRNLLIKILKQKNNPDIMVDIIQSSKDYICDLIQAAYERGRNDGLEEAAFVSCYGCRKEHETFMHLNTICHREANGVIVSCSAASIRALKREPK